jgi:3-hydroxyacyl-[acyl-carrier-protein] dehydratase
MDMPEVLSVQAQAGLDKIRVALAIPASLDVFKGHFDGAPIVPGVVQINWALKLANQYLREIPPEDIAHMEAVKFQHVMVPGCDPVLELEMNGNKLAFTFLSPTETAVRYSSGKVVLGP